MPALNKFILTTMIMNGACLNIIAAAFFKKLMLEAFQSGLSWIIVLKKCDNFRSAFVGFNPHILVDWG